MYKTHLYIRNIIKDRIQSLHKTNYERPYIILSLSKNYVVRAYMRIRMWIIIFNIKAHGTNMKFIACLKFILTIHNALSYSSFFLFFFFEIIHVIFVSIHNQWNTIKNYNITIIMFRKQKIMIYINPGTIKWTINHQLLDIR